MVLHAMISKKYMNEFGGFHHKMNDNLTSDGTEGHGHRLGDGRGWCLGRPEWTPTER